MTFTITIPVWAVDGTLLGLALLFTMGAVRTALEIRLFLLKNKR